MAQSFSPSLFKKELAELIRLKDGLENELRRKTNQFSAYADAAKKAFSLMGKKYPSLSVGLSVKPAGISVKILIRERSCKDAFLQAARIEGLSAIGTSSFNQVKVEETDKFSKEIDRLKNRLFLTYGAQNAMRSTMLLSSAKKGWIEVAADFDIALNNPLIALLLQYASRGTQKKLSILEFTRSIGFTENPHLEQARSYFKGFDPKMDDI
ncbi:hypothetical protein HYU14_00545 [Candidatus Woesearchaeota archaeon]|nr:hypothetical protein [Candidatus Woesearchaeota archaeon]